MTDAFAATYSDWKVIKGRKVVQLVFELPIEKADEAYQVLGGMPIAAHEVWCGIARLKGGDATGAGTSGSRSATQPRPIAATSAGADKPKSPAQIAGYLCTLQAFQAFLAQKYPLAWRLACNEADSDPRLDEPDTDEEVAARCVRNLCQVHSRRDLTDKNTEWNALRLAYQLWLNEPDLDIVA